MNPIYQQLKIGTWLYFLMVIFSGLGMGLVDPHFFIAADPSETLRRLQSSGFYFRLGIVSNLIGQTLFLGMAFHFYNAFKSLDQHLSRLLLGFVAVSIPITFVSVLFQFNALSLLAQPNYLASFSGAQIQGLVMSSLETHKTGLLIAQIFWGLWLWPFGLLVYRSGYLPKFLGVLLVLGSLGYLFDRVLFFLIPERRSFAAPGLVISGLAEFSFILWVLLKGSSIKETFSSDSKKSTN